MESWDTLSSEHGTAVAHMTSRQVWLLAQNLHKIESVKIPAWMGQELLRTPPRKAFGIWWRLTERATFFTDVAPVADPTPRCLWVAQFELSSFKRR